MAKQNQRRYNEDVIRQQREQQKINAELLKNLKEQNQALKDQVTAREEAVKQEELLFGLTDKSQALLKQLAGFTREDLSSKAKRNKLLELTNQALEEQQKLEQQAKEEFEKTRGLTGKQLIDQRKIAETLSDQANTIGESVINSQALLREFNRFDKVSGWLGNLEKLTKDIPILRDVFGFAAKGAKAAGENFKKTGSIGEAKMAGLKAAAGGLVTVLVGALIGGIIKGLTGIDKSITSLQTKLTQTAEIAGKVSARLQKAANIKVTFDQLTEATIALSDSLQTASVGAISTVKTVFTLTKRLGMSADQATNLFRFASATGRAFNDAAADVVGLTAALNDANNTNLRYSDILNDVASASADTLLTTQNFPGGIARAAFEARKLGLSLSNLSSAQSSLLDFESSIAAELEAELMLGKDINLQKAREAALTGDQTKIAQELNRIIGENGDVFEKNVLAQDALAKSLGISRQEVAQSILQRKALLALEKESKIEGLSRLSTEEQIEKLTQKYAEDGLDAAQARSKALRELGQDELDRMEKTQTAQDDLKNALELVGLRLGTLISELTGSSNPLRSLSDNIMKLTDVIAEWLMGGLDEKERKQRDELIALEEERAAKAEEEGKEYTPKTAEEISNLIKGARGNNFVDALGIGLGPAGISNFLVNKERRKSAKESLNELSVNDFTIRTNPKDTLVMAGGTKLGDETNMLLKELITAVKQGGQVYIDGRRVDEVVRMNRINQ